MLRFAWLLLVVCQGSPASAPSVPAAKGALDAPALDFARLGDEDRLHSAIAEVAKKAYVSITVERGPVEVVFSGTLVDGQGRVAVPASGVVNATRIFARCDGRTFAADVWYEDPTLPIAIVKLRTNDIDKAPPAPALAAEASLGIGHVVVLVSNAHDFEGTIQFGRVSGIDRRVNLLPEFKLLQTTISAAPGTPGGVLTNARGEVAGVLLGGPELNSRRITQVELLTIQTAPIQMSPIQGPTVGGQMLPLTQSSQVGDARPLAVGQGIPSQEGMAANGQARVAVNTITRFDSRRRTDSDMSLVLPIDRVANVIHNVQNTIRSRSEGAADGAPYMGVFLKEGLDEPLRVALDLAPGFGLMVDDIVEASPAKAADIRRFDVFVKLDGEPIRTNEQFRQCLVAAAVRGGFDIDLLRGGKPLRVRVNLASAK